jgi:hydroxyacylglutathione hydrolase
VRLCVRDFRLLSAAMSNPLQIEGFCLSQFMTNGYIVWIEGDRECWIIDAPGDPQPMIEAIEARGLQPSRLLLTHGHADHIAGIDAVHAKWKIPVSIHEAEAEFLTNPELNLSAFFDMPFTVAPADELLRGDESLTLADRAFEILFVPGHSPGSICFHQPEAKIAVVGDTLFAGSIGRTDFPTSDGPALLEGIREKLLTLDDETRLFPGHMDPTTVGQEKQHNPFVGVNARWQMPQ